MVAIRVLYVEDDERLARLTSEYLASHEVEVEVVAGGEQAVAAVARLRPDVVLLDLMLPGIDGLEVCRRISARHDVRIIMVTARSEPINRVAGLEGGADDYVTKPFHSRELLARIRAQARRGRGEVGPRSNKVVVGELVVDLGAHEVTLRGRPVAMTTNELAVIAGRIELTSAAGQGTRARVTIPTTAV